MKCFYKGLFEKIPKRRIVAFLLLTLLLCVIGVLLRPFSFFISQTNLVSVECVPIDAPLFCGLVVDGDGAPFPCYLEFDDISGGDGVETDENGFFRYRFHNDPTALLINFDRGMAVKINQTYYRNFLGFSGGLLLIRVFRK